MAMVPFHRMFGKDALRETRVAYTKGRDDLPDGEYAFVESYCDEAECDCRRVLISVFLRDSGKDPLATISYGWEEASFYENLLGMGIDGEESKGPLLDPINPQSQYSHALLALFKEMIQDSEYVARFASHYAMVKRSLS